MVGQRRVGKARRQRDARVAALAGVDPAFDRRRRRGEHDREAADAGAHHRHVARIVEDAILLLVGGVVLLVDDDQAELPERQEQRRARAGDDAHAAFRDLPPDPFAHARRQVGMPFGRLGAEAVLEALEKGLGQRDFRQQDQHLLAAVERRGDRLEIDLGLARAGDAVEQRDAEAAGGGGLRAEHRPQRACSPAQRGPRDSSDRVPPPPAAAGSSPARTRPARSARR